MFCVLRKKKYPSYVSKRNSNREKQIIFNDFKWRQTRGQRP